MATIHPDTNDHVLRMHEVSIRSHGSKQGRLRQFSMDVPAGHLTLVHRPPTEPRTMLVDAIMGMSLARRGSISFLQHDWSRTPMRQRLALRSKIGRVFADGGWISNLSLLDNLKLPLRHHTSRTDHDIDVSLNNLAKRFQVEIPNSRVAFVSKPVLRVCQWIRAFLVQPKLLVVESPLDEVPDEQHHLFMAAEREHRDSGGATVWITTNSFVWQRDIKGQVSRMKISDERLRSIAS